MLDDFFLLGKMRLLFFNNTCMKIVNNVSLLLVIIGALNWGLVGIGSLIGSNWNLVNLIFGSIPTLEAIVYLLVGISAILHLKNNCSALKNWK